MLPGKMYSPEEILRIILRSRWLILLPAVLGLTVGVAASTRLPEKYRSETLILVVPQRIPTEIVPRTNTETVADRLNTINDLILSRSRLERIIRDLQLYGQRPDAIMEDIVQRMRDNDIKVRVEGRESFRVTYVSDTAKTAQIVTDRLASLYIEENLRDQVIVSQSTNEFIESQLDDAKRRLQEQERKLEEYKSRHAGELPSQLTGNLQAIQSAQSQLLAVSESTNRARERRILIERQLADAETIPVPARPPEGSTGTTEPTALSVAQQLELAEARLALYKQRYTPDHPDVKTLERTIVELQKKIVEEAKQPGKTAPKILSPADAARQRQVSELRAQLEAIDHQISSNQQEERRLKSLVADYQNKVNAVPARESELVELMRDYSTVNESYSSLLKKQQDSKLAENLVRRQIGEQFKVLDPASLPQRPYNRLQRILIIVAGPLVGVAIGLGVLGLREYRDSSLKSEADVARVLDLPVLALVPMLESDREQRVRVRRTRLIDVGGCAIVLVTVAALIVWRLQS